MLNAWHLPVAPFVKQNKDNLVITLWLAGENQPERVMLRAEIDNEETGLKMHKLRSQPQPGITAWRANIDLNTGQPRRRYSFKLLWNNRQLWFTPQGFSRFPPARLEQFAVDYPDNGPQWVNEAMFENGVGVDIMQSVTRFLHQQPWFQTSFSRPDNSPDTPSPRHETVSSSLLVD